MGVAAKEAPGFRAGLAGRLGEGVVCDGVLVFAAVPLEVAEAGLLGRTVGGFGGAAATVVPEFRAGLAGRLVEGSVCDGMLVFVAVLDVVETGLLGAVEPGFRAGLAGKLGELVCDGVLVFVAVPLEVAETGLLG